MHRSAVCNTYTQEMTAIIEIMHPNKDSKKMLKSTSAIKNGCVWSMIPKMTEDEILDYLQQGLKPEVATIVADFPDIPFKQLRRALKTC